MTNQELYDKVAKHLLTQMEQSKDDEGLCVYRGPRGLKCAIGCLIPDDKYSPDLEGPSVASGAVQDAAGLYPYNVALARSLQFIHDCHDPSVWGEQLASLAYQVQLQPYEGVVQ